MLETNYLVIDEMSVDQPSTFDQPSLINRPSFGLLTKHPYTAGVCPSLFARSLQTSLEKFILGIFRTLKVY